MRKSLGLTQEDLTNKTGVHSSVLTRLEHDKVSPRKAPPILGRVLPALKDKFQEAFPETGGDPYDFIYAPKSFGRWLKNLRARRALTLRALAAALKVRPFTIIRYENDLSRPEPAVRARLRRVYQLNGDLDRFFKD